MSQKPEEYGLLSQEDSSEDDLPPYRPFLLRRKRWLCLPSSALLLIISIFLNSVLLVVVLTTSDLTPWQDAPRSGCRSEYAGLKEPNVVIDWSQSRVYSSDNYSLADMTWDALDMDSGIVAVPKTWAAEKSLPLGSTFPWDQSKTIYLVNAYHGLHCLKNIYRSMMEYRLGKPQSLTYHHVIHCLDQLLADVMCNADDSLRVTTPDNQPNTAVGQQRICRDWDALRQWTLKNPACWRYGQPEVEDTKPNQLPRMRYCAEGSPELDRVREYFGKGTDWKPVEEPKWSWMEN